MKAPEKSESERFVDLAKRLVSIPKKDVDKRIENERSTKTNKKPSKDGLPQK